MAAYLPDRGDVVHVNLGNTGGTREFDGPHYAIVLSPAPFNKRCGLCYVVPTTSKFHPDLGGLAVRVPRLPNLKKEAWALLHHVRSIDFKGRAASLADRLDPTNAEHKSFLDGVVDDLFVIIG